MKKILSFMLMLVLMLSMAVIPAYATDDLGMVIVCDDYTIAISGDGECIIKEYTGTDSVITIPQELEGMMVTAIDKYAFAYNRHLISVTVPTTVHTIGEGAFFYCYNLDNITIPAETENIGEKAFGYNRRKLDLETLTYTYRPDPTFTVYAPEGSAAASFAKECGYELNANEMFNDFATYLMFRIPYQWKEFNNVYCHIWDLETGEIFINWQSNREKCEIYYDHVEYSPDVFGGLNPDSVYGVIFSTDAGDQTYPAIFTYRCSGDILYTDNTYVYTPEDTMPRLQEKWAVTDMSDYEEAFDFYKHCHFATPDEATPEEATPDALPWGDANCDGVVNVKDATAIQKHLADIIKLSDTGLILCNFINKETPLTVRNATEIQKFCADIRTFEKIGKPAVTRVVVERPKSWYRQEMKALSWTDPRKVQTIPDSSEYVTNEQHAVFFIPIYNNNIAISCKDYTSEAMVVNFYEGDDNGNNEYFCDVFLTDDDSIRFIWTTFD